MVHLIMHCTKWFKLSKSSNGSQRYREVLCWKFFNKRHLFEFWNWSFRTPCFKNTYTVKGMMAIWSSHRTIRSTRGGWLRGWSSGGRYLRSPCEQFTWYGGGEYTPDASTRPLPHFRSESGTIGNHEVLQAVGTRPRKLLVIWGVKGEQQLVMKKKKTCSLFFTSHANNYLVHNKKWNFYA